MGDTLRVGANHLQGVVGGGAVNNDVLNVGPSLLRHRAHGRTDGFGAVVADSND